MTRHPSNVRRRVVAVLFGFLVLATRVALASYIETYDSGAIAQINRVDCTITLASELDSESKIYTWNEVTIFRRNGERAAAALVPSNSRIELIYYDSDGQLILKEVNWIEEKILPEV